MLGLWRSSLAPGHFQTCGRSRHVTQSGHFTRCISVVLDEWQQLILCQIAIWVTRVEQSEGWRKENRMLERRFGAFGICSGEECRWWLHPVDAGKCFEGFLAEELPLVQEACLPVRKRAENQAAG